MSDKSLSKKFIAGFGLAFVLLSGLALAEDGHDRHERGDRRGVYFDEHYHHRHYYPAIGFSMPLLPAESLALTFNGGRIFFNAGVWYRPMGSGFVVVRPPVGIAIPMLPPGYSTVWSGSSPYYYANETYYSATPNGYVVVAPPTGPVNETPPQTYISAPPQATPPATSPPPVSDNQASHPPAAGYWYYCESSKAYYPYVNECREGWRQVPANPPPAQ